MFVIQKAVKINAYFTFFDRTQVLVWHASKINLEPKTNVLELAGFYIAFSAFYDIFAGVLFTSFIIWLAFSKLYWSWF